MGKSNYVLFATSQPGSSIARCTLGDLIDMKTIPLKQLVLFDVLFDLDLTLTNFAQQTLQSY